MDSSLGLRLSNTNSGLGSKKELNLLGDLNFVPTKNDVVAVGREEETTLGCIYCPKTFSDYRALGLHLRVHLIERVWTKRVMQKAIFDRVQARLHSMLGSSNHLPHGRSRLGININSPVISKPPFPSGPGLAHALARWPRTHALQNTSRSWVPMGVFRYYWPVGFNSRPIAHSAGSRIRSDGSVEINFQETIYPPLGPNNGPVAYAAGARTRSDGSKEIIFLEEVRR